MRTLLYVPIIHTNADLGSLAKNLNDSAISGLGEIFWIRHTEIVNSFWDAIKKYFDSLDTVSDLKIYQDGLVADAEIGIKIVEEGIKSGSKNYEIVAGLIKRGAVLMKTEDLALVKKEYDKLIKITKVKSKTMKILGFLKYKLTKHVLINKRDKYIASQINKTLQNGGTGILFIGAQHNVKKWIDRDIQIKEIKDPAKIKEYHQLLPFYYRNRKKFDALARYLVSEVREVLA